MDTSLKKKLQGARISLTPFAEAHITPRYLSWLSDDRVNKFSRRFGSRPVSADEARKWLSGLAPEEGVYAILAPEYGHIGNIKFGPINRSNLSADISIVIGEIASWGHGYGAEAIYLVSKHLFFEKGVNRLAAASINPAFIRTVERLGWTREGIQREESLIGGKYFDSILLSHLRREFRENAAFEPELSGTDG